MTHPDRRHDDELARLSLRVGDRVRYQRRPGGAWHEATVVGIEADGSVALRDLATRAARSLPAHRLEVRVRGRRGAVGWRPALAGPGREEQLGLW